MRFPTIHFFHLGKTEFLWQWTGSLGILAVACGRYGLTLDFKAKTRDIIHRQYVKQATGPVNCETCGQSMTKDSPMQIVRFCSKECRKKRPR